MVRRGKEDRAWFVPLRQSGRFRQGVRAVRSVWEWLAWSIPFRLYGVWLGSFRSGWQGGAWWSYGQFSHVEARFRFGSSGMERHGDLGQGKAVVVSAECLWQVAVRQVNARLGLAVMECQRMVRFGFVRLGSSGMASYGLADTVRFGSYVPVGQRWFRLGVEGKDWQIGYGLICCGGA